MFSRRAARSTLGPVIPADACGLVLAAHSLEGVLPVEAAALLGRQFGDAFPHLPRPGIGKEGRIVEVHGDDAEQEAAHLVRRARAEPDVARRRKGIRWI